MKLGPSLGMLMSVATLQLGVAAHAEDRRGGHEQHPGGQESKREDRHEDRREDRREDRHEDRHEDRREVRNDQRLPQRAPAPAWRGHPPGTHPTAPGWHPGYHPHAVRVLRPHVLRYGDHPWRHWGHAEVARPVYYWNWAAVRSVTCIAEDSYGDQYPVTESTFAGFGLPNMTQVEDDALDRCYDESGGDESCFLTTCSGY